MHVADWMDIFAGLLTIALVATILNKRNTAADINAAGSQFTAALREAKA